jgi:thiol-disulfide isomerase/thioredoxin
MGIRYNEVSQEVRSRFGLDSGAVSVVSVLPDSPARIAGLEPGDIIIGPPGEAFIGRDRIREWVMAAPIGEPQALLIQRGMRRFRVSLTPMPEPGRWSDVSVSAKVGSAAPSLDKLRPYRGTLLGEGHDSQPYILFFFATWCAPCKASLPKLGVFEQQRHIPVIAITDESSLQLDELFKKQKGFFPQRVMMDELRTAFIAYGVNGTPTFVLVDSGRIKNSKVGYRVDQGLHLQ